MSTQTNLACTPKQIHAHADAINHAAARGGWVDDISGQRHPLTEPERRAWQRDAAALREAAYAMKELTK